MCGSCSIIQSTLLFLLFEDIDYYLLFSVVHNVSFIISRITNSLLLIFYFFFLFLYDLNLWFNFLNVIEMIFFLWENKEKNVFLIIYNMYIYIYNNICVCLYIYTHIYTVWGLKLNVISTKSFCAQLLQYMMIMMIKKLFISEVNKYFVMCVLK